jgi:hypothetical protein
MGAETPGSTELDLHGQDRPASTSVTAFQMMIGNSW